MRRESQFKTIVGGTKKEKKRAQKELGDLFKDVENSKFEQYEIETTSRDEEIIDDTVESVSDTIESYGAEPNLSPRKNIHILREGSVDEFTDGRFKEAYYSVLHQSVAVERIFSDTGFALCLAHEFFHLKSYKSAQIDKEGDLMPRRSGISTWNKETGIEYFGELNEAVVVELVRRFYDEKMRKNPLYEKEIKATDEIKKNLRELFQLLEIKQEMQDSILEELYYIPDAEGLLKEIEKRKSKEERLSFLHGALDAFIDTKHLGDIGRQHERKKFSDLLDRILQSQNTEINDREKLFEVFAKAHLTGHYLPLARIVEKSLGKGSFRHIAEEFSQTEQIK